MPRVYSNILDITPTSDKNWTVLVQVVELGPTQQSKDLKNYRRLLFTDTKGTTMPAIIFSFHLKHFEHVFTLYRKYYVSNANLITTDPHFVDGPYTHTWSLTKQTLVEPHANETITPLPCKLYKHAETGTNQNIRGVVVRCFPSHKINPGQPSSKRDIVIVNEEKQPMILTLWDSFDTEEGQALEEMLENTPIIYAMRIKVTTFYGLSLTTRKESAIMINPPVPDEVKLLDWKASNNQELLELLNRESYKNVDELLPYPEETDILPSAIAREMMKAVSLHVKLIKYATFPT
ncbi:hypothetical protein LXL04_016762 [Taraxacum kok-saghyz]